MARIFIAIRFNDELKKVLVALQDALKERGVQGNYCPYGNLHMTLAFIGESYDLTAIRKAVSEVEFEPFELTLDGLGSFPTKAGVIWCGLKDNAPVIELAKQLEEDVKKLGFKQLSIMRPPSLIRKDTDRFGERVSVKLLQALNTVGLLRSIRPMPTSQVAKAMIAMVKEQREGFYILEPKDLWRI